MPPAAQARGQRAGPSRRSRLLCCGRSGLLRVHRACSSRRYRLSLLQGRVRVGCRGGEDGHHAWVGGVHHQHGVALMAHERSPLRPGRSRLQMHRARAQPSGRTFAPVPPPRPASHPWPGVLLTLCLLVRRHTARPSGPGNNSHSTSSGGWQTGHLHDLGHSHHPGGGAQEGKAWHVRWRQMTMMRAAERHPRPPSSHSPAFAAAPPPSNSPRSPPCELS